MNIRDLLFGPKKDEPTDGAEQPVDPAAPAAPEDDITQSREVIHNSSGDEYWEEFQSAIENMTAKELNALSYRLGAGVPDFSNWRDYVDAIRMFQWFRFCEAYHWATRQTFSLSK